MVGELRKRCGAKNERDDARPYNDAHSTVTYRVISCNSTSDTPLELYFFLVEAPTPNSPRAVVAKELVRLAERRGPLCGTSAVAAADQQVAEIPGLRRLPPGVALVRVPRAPHAQYPDRNVSITRRLAQDRTAASSRGFNSIPRGVNDPGHKNFGFVMGENLGYPMGSRPKSGTVLAHFSWSVCMY